MDIGFFEAVTPYWIDFHNDLHKAGFVNYYLLDNFSYGNDSLEKGLNYVPQHLAPGGKTRWRMKELRDLIRANRPETVITPEFSLFTIQVILLKYLMKRSFRVVVRCDDSYDMLVHPRSRRHAISARLLVPFVDDLILCDDKTVSYYRNKSGKGIYFPIIRKADSFRSAIAASRDTAASMAREYGIEGKHVFMFVGRLAEEKNIRLFIDAAKALDRQDVEFVVVGDGVLRKELETAAAGRVLFTGLQSGERLSAWYGIADYFVLPSTFEPFGAVVNEALLAGCWSLVSNKAGAAGLVQPGINGLLIDPDSVESLLAAMNDALEHVPVRDGFGMKADLMQITYEDRIAYLINSLKR